MEIFDKLKEYIDKEVICYIYHGDTVFVIRQVLKEVNDYTGVTIGNIRYPFITRVSGIGRITTLNNEIIYENSIINEEYFSESEEVLENYKKQMYGDNYHEKKKAYNYQKHLIKPKNVN